jgi:PAS domain S-box-containing protein
MPEPIKTPRPKILIIEDEALIALDLQTALRSWGYSVLDPVLSAEEALAVIKQTPPDLIMIDIVLQGGIDGIEAAEIIRSQWGIPVVFITAYADLEKLDKAKLTVPFGYLLKPFQEREVQVTVEMALYVFKMDQERKKAEEEVRRLKDFYGLILENVQDGIWVTDEKDRMIFFNPAMEKIAGVKAGDVLGLNVTRDFPQEATGEFLQYYHQAKEQGNPQPYEVRVVTPAGRQTVQSGWLIPRFNKGHYLGMICSIQDITDIKRMGEERLAMSKRESTELLAGGIAHDFNNLLSVILGNLDLAIGFEQSKEEMTKSLEAAMKAALESRKLTHQLITLAKGGATFKKLISLPPLLKEQADFTLRGSRVAADCSLPEDLWMVKVDEGQIGQVIRNLVLNAREAMEEGGRISITAENAVLTLPNSFSLPPGDYLTVRFSDQGKSIPEEILPKIFDPYFSTKQRGVQKGMGLGLTICQSIIQKHGGTIDVKSLSGEGTTFQIYLPAFREAIPVQESPRSASSPKGRILVMDDEEMVRSMVGSILKRLGYEVEMVENGERVIEAYQTAQTLARPFDAFLLDLTVRGGMGGKETIRRLLKLDPEVKAIVLSGYDQSKVIQEYEVYGFKAALTKPFLVDDLKTILIKILEKNSLGER